MQATITQATTNDYETIAAIGNVAVYNAHAASCPAADMKAYLDAHYNHDAIKQELANPDNIYNIIYGDGRPAGLSKIILNAAHPNIDAQNVTKLDRIYLLEEFYGLGLGTQLLDYNIDLSVVNKQAGIWLFTWTGNLRAVNFYLKSGFAIIGTHQFKVSNTHSNPNHHMLLSY